MSYQFSNLSGEALSLMRGGVTHCTVPVGFSGEVSFVGPFDVWTNPTVGVVNQTNTVGGASTTGYSLVTIENQTPFAVSMVEWLGSNTPDGVVRYNTSGEAVDASGAVLGYNPFPLGWAVGSIGRVEFGNSVAYEYGTVPNVAHSVLRLTGQDGYITGQFITTNEVVTQVTNVIAGRQIGTFGQYVRQVTVGKDAVQVSDYGRHIELFSWGFAVAFSILITRWVLNIIGSIGGREDDI